MPAALEARTARRGARELEAGQAEIAARQAEADRLLGDELTALEASNPEAERVQSLSDYTLALRRGRQQAEQPSLPSNLGGERYQRDVAASNQAGRQQARATADLVSRIDAPTRQREREARSVGRTMSNVQELGAQSRTAQFLASLRARRQRTNPWATLLAQLGTQIANNYEPRDRSHVGIEVDPSERYIDTVPRDRRITL